MFLAAPAIVIVLLMAFYWALFAPPGTDKPTPTPTIPALAAQPTQGPTLSLTLTPMVATATLPVLPVLALTTPGPTPLSTPLPGTRAAPMLAPGAKAVVYDTGRSGLNVRSDAGTTFPKVGSVPEGFTVEVIAGPREADGYVWYQVKDETGVNGWAAANFLRAQ
jgi:uncharacterized protein YgiM (DUF1202 family)